MMDVVEICQKVLKRLSTMDCERANGFSEQRLVFPNIFPSEHQKDKITETQLLKNLRRISEQEVRFLFVEEFLKQPEYFYSVETPTEKKYSFGKTKDDVPKADINGQSASIDLCILKRQNQSYERVLNIEFKFDNVPAKQFSKDLLKLMHEEQDGAFVLLLKNMTDTTLKSVQTKIADAHKMHQNKWNGNKTIEIVILGLHEHKSKAPFFLNYKIRQTD